MAPTHKTQARRPTRTGTIRQPDASLPREQTDGIGGKNRGGRAGARRRRRGLAPPAPARTEPVARPPRDTTRRGHRVVGERRR